MVGGGEVVIVAIAIGECTREIAICLIVIAASSANCSSHIVSLAARQNTIVNNLGCPSDGFLITTEFVQGKSTKRGNVVVKHQHKSIVAFCQVVLTQSVAIEPCTKHQSLRQLRIVENSHIERRKSLIIIIFGNKVEGLFHKSILVVGIEGNSETQRALCIIVKGHSALYLATGHIIVSDAVIGTNCHTYRSERIVVASECILRLCLVVIDAMILK